MDTTAITKKRRVMDMPIYLEFSVGDCENPGTRWLVIEEKDEPNKSQQVEGEFGDDLMLCKNENDRLRDLHLPDSGYVIYDNSIIADGSRFFVIGGHQSSSPKGYMENEILYIDLRQSQSCWQRSTADDVSVRIPSDLDCSNGAAVFGDWIYVVGRLTVIRFHRLDVDKRTRLPDLPFNHVPPRLLALTASKKILLFWRLIQGGVQLRSYDLESGSLEIIDESLPWCRHTPSDVVLVKDSYLILFAYCHPATEEYYHPGLYVYHPGLYVYDLGRRQWLPEPVQGLPNDDTVLPSFQDQLSIGYSSVVQVRRDELKFAMIWTFERGEAHIHWTKFTLAIQENVDEDLAPTFHAGSLSTGVFNCPLDTGCLVNCTAG